MVEGADIKVAHETRASRPEGCLPFLPGGTLSHLVEVSLQGYGPAAQSGVCVLTENERTVLLAVLFHRLKPHPHTSVSGESRARSTSSQVRTQDLRPQSWDLLWEAEPPYE